MSKVNGTLFAVYHDSDKILYATAATLTTDQDLPSVTTKESGGNAGHIRGLRKWSIDFAGRYDEDDTPVGITADDVMALIIAGAVAADIKFEATDGSIDKSWTGSGTIQNMKILKNTSQPMDYSGSIQGTGELIQNWSSYWTTQVEAKAFGDAAGIADEPTQRALADLVNELKAINTIQADFVNFATPANSVLKAIYPFAGTTADNHKYNLIDPRDQDAAGRLVYTADVVHTNGLKSDGDSGYANTKLNFNVFASNNFSFGMYRSENNIGGNKTFGYTDPNPLYMQHNTASVTSTNIDLHNMFGGTNRLASTKQWTSIGWFVGNNQDGTKIVIGDNLVAENALYVDTACPDREIYLVAINNAGGPGLFDKDNLAFMFFGGGLIAGVYTPLKNAVYKFIKALGRTKPILYFHGDSITRGLNASDPSFRYATVLTGLCSGYTEFNKGTDGQTIVDWYNLLSATGGVNNTVDHYNDPDSIMIIGHGVNDAGAGQLQAFEDSIDFIHNSKFWPYDKIVLTGPFIKTDADIPAQSTYNQQVKTMAEAKGCRFVDVFDALNGTTGYVDADNIHLTDAGHAFIANLIHARLTAWGLI